MRKFAVALLVATALLAAAVFADDTEESGPTEVLVLDDANFEATAQEHDTLLIEFYAPWCGHCKALSPKYDEASLTLAKAGLKIAKLDADANKMMGGKHGVKSFPTLKLFRNGEFAEDYEGERTAEAIVEYVTKKSKTAATNQEITTLTELKTIVKGKNVEHPTVVGFFATKDGVDYKYFKAVVSQLADTGIKVYHTSSQSVLEGFGFYSSGSSIQMYRPTGKPFKITFRGTIFKEALKKWVLENALAGVAHYAPGNQKLYTLQGKTVLRVAVKAESDRKAAEKMLAPLAKEADGKILYATSLIADYTAEVEAECGKDVATCAMISEASGRRLFGLAAPADTAALQDFVEKFNAKKLVAKVKSEPIPAAAAKGEVAVVVGNTFTRDVVESEKNVMIEFYAPWCGHCKALAPKYDELAKDLADNEDVLVAKFDMTANDIPKEFQGQFEVQGFPTIYFAAKGEKAKPVQYKGNREAADLKKYILENKK